MNPRRQHLPLDLLSLKVSNDTGEEVTTSRKGIRRTSLGLPERTTVLIVGEGRETEPNYFLALAKLDVVRQRFTIHVRRGPGYSPERVVKLAIQEKQKAIARGESFDEVWCVVDTETGTDKRESLDRAVIMARRETIDLCLSNPAFEVWFLSHFMRTTRSFLNCDAVIQELNKHWKTHFSQLYEKGDRRHFHRLEPFRTDGIANAQWVREDSSHRDEPNTADCNSSTEVYRLVKRFCGL